MSSSSSSETSAVVPPPPPAPPLVSDKSGIFPTTNLIFTYLEKHAIIPKNALELLNIVCTVVEEIAKNSKTKLPSDAKRALAVDLLRGALPKLLELGYIPEEVYIGAKLLLDNNEQILETIDTIIAIWNQFLKNAPSICSKIFPCCCSK